MKGVFTSLLMGAKVECERVSLKLKQTNKQTKKLRSWDPVPLPHGK